MTISLKKISERIKFLRSLSVNHWRHLLRNLSEKEINRVLILLGLAAAASLFLSGYDYWALRTPAPAQGGSYSEGIVGEPRYINPVVSLANEVDRDIATLVFAGLVKHDETGKIVPDLAQSYQVKDGGKTYEFTLRDNLTWPDKKPLTADDVVFTVNLIKDPKFQSPLRNNWQGVKMEKIDEKKVVAKLPVAYQNFLESAIVGILPQHVWSAVQPQNFLLTQLNLKPIGLGPYQLQRITKNSSGAVKSMEFSPNPRYYEEARIARLVLRFYQFQDEAINAYRRREIDGLALNSVAEKQLLKSRAAKFYNLKLPRYFAVFFNQTKSTPLADLEVRRALAQASDKSRIISEIFANEAQIQNGPFPFGLLSIDPPGVKYEFDPATAETILEKAGWKRGERDVREKKLKGDKTPTGLEFTLSTTDWPEMTQAASILKDDWEKIGAKVNLDVVPVNAIQNQVIRPRQYEALLFGEVLGLDPDPFSFWHSTQRKDPGLNLALYNNKKVDGLLESARQTADDEEKTAKYEQFQKIIMQDLPAVFLYSPDYIYAVAKKVKGLNTTAVNTPSQRFENINKWYIATKRVKK